MVSLNQNFKPKSNVYFIYLFIFFFLNIKFSCSDNITARNSKTKCYKKLHLKRCSGVLRTGAASIFMREGCKSGIMDFLHEPWTVITETAIYQYSVWSN